MGIDEELLDDPDQNIEVAPELVQTEEDQGPEEEQFNKNEVEEVVDQTDEELTQEFLEDLYYNKDVAEVDNSEEMVEEGIFEEPELNEETNDVAEDQDQDIEDVPEDETVEKQESKMKKLLSLIW